MHLQQMSAVQWRLMGIKTKKMYSSLQKQYGKDKKMSKGRYGNYGGQYIPETLMNAVLELEEAYEKYSKDPEFNKELDDLLKNYAGRPSL